MARKVIDIIYNFVRKRLAGQAPKGIVTKLPESAQIEQGMQEVFKTLRSGNVNPVSADNLIKTEDDLAMLLNKIVQDNNRKTEAIKKADEGITRVFDKMRRGIPLNPDDQAALQGSGFKTTLDNFKGFEPKVIPGGKGKKPRDKKSKGGLIKAVKALRKKFGKDIIQKGKAPKDRGGRKKLRQMFKDFEKRTKKEGGGLAYMLGEPREEMAAGGPALRRLMQFLNKGVGKTGSQGLKEMKLPKQVKFFAEKQGFNPDQIRINYLEQILETLKADRKIMRGLEPDAPSGITGKAKDEMELMADDIFKKQFLSTTQEGRFKDLTPEMIDSSILELETMIKNLKTKGRKLNADGGRIGFADGGMSRRTFLKIMAAIAAFPVVGKLAKTTKVAKGVKPIVTPTAEMPAHFPKLVEKILKEGQVVKKDFVKKTGDVTTYKHPDRPDIELTVEGEGNRIQLDFETDQGMKAGYEFRKGDIIDDPASPMRGKRGPNEFNQGEVKYKGDSEGNYYKDFEEGIDTGTENLDDFAGVGKQETSKSKVNVDAYDDLAVPDEDFADGGLAGLLGE